MESTTEKLPKGRSYPLKPSKLASAVEEARLALPVELTRWDRYDAALKADFYPDGEWPGKEGEFFWVRCRAVPADNASALRSVLESQAIPRFVEWAKSIEALHACSPIRREKQTFSFAYPRLDN